MIKEFARELGLYRDGELDKGRVLLVVIPVTLFFTWRVMSLGVSGSEDILAAIEQELVIDYQQTLRAEQDTADGQVSVVTSRRAFPIADGGALSIELSKVSMSAPLLSWSAVESVEVRFDYVIRLDGVTVERGATEYRHVNRKGGLVIHESSAFSYYLNYIL